MTSCMQANILRRALGNNKNKKTKKCLYSRIVFRSIHLFVVLFFRIPGG